MHEQPIVSVAAGASPQNECTDTAGRRNDPSLARRRARLPKAPAPEAAPLPATMWTRKRLEATIDRQEIALR